MIRILIIGSAVAAAILTALGGTSTFTYLLNGRRYQETVAPPHRDLPAIGLRHPGLLRTPGTNDILACEFGGTTVTCRVDALQRLVCSDGMEMDLGARTVQEVFQILAETHILLHSPQVPPRVKLEANRALHFPAPEITMPFDTNSTIIIQRHTNRMENIRTPPWPQPLP